MPYTIASRKFKQSRFQYVCDGMKIEHNEENEPIRGIPKEIRNRHIWIVLLKDFGDTVVYINKPSNSIELHKVRIAEEATRTIKDRTFTSPRRKALAGDEEFGVYALCYGNLSHMYKSHPKLEKYNGELVALVNKNMWCGGSCE